MFKALGVFLKHPVAAIIGTAILIIAVVMVAAGQQTAVKATRNGIWVGVFSSSVLYHSVKDETPSAWAAGRVAVEGQPTDFGDLQKAADKAARATQKAADKAAKEK